MATSSSPRAEEEERGADTASARARDVPAGPAPGRGPFGVKDTAVVLAVAALVTVLLDTEGLLGWAQRLEVGPAQATLLRVLRPVHAATSAVGVAAPRRWVAARREQLAAALGGEGDPLLAEGWVLAAVSGTSRPVAPPPLDARGEDGGAPAAPAPAAAPPGPGEDAPSPVPVAVEAVGGGVLILGDSMMAGTLGATLERTLAKGTGLPVARAAQLGTGLSRPDVFDWMRVGRALLAREKPRYVVVALGANDATNLREGEEQLDYGEPRWGQVYLGRVEAMMTLLSGTGARVLWLALPPMRDVRLNARGRYLNGLAAQGAKKVPRVEVLALDVLVGDKEGQYATFVMAPDGKLRRYRLDDGVHLAPAGAHAVAGWVLDWVTERER